MVARPARGAGFGPRSGRRGRHRRGPDPPRSRIRCSATCDAQEDQGRSREVCQGFSTATGQSAKGHVRDVQAARRPDSLSERATLNPSHAVPPDAEGATCGGGPAVGGEWQKASPILGPTRIRRRCSCAMDLMRAKLYGFLGAAGKRWHAVIRRATRRLPRATPAAPSPLIASLRRVAPLPQIDALHPGRSRKIRTSTKLKGQALLEAGRPGESGSVRCVRPSRIAPSPAADPDHAGARRLSPRADRSRLDGGGCVCFDPAGRRDP